MSNQELADHVDFAFQVFGESLAMLRAQTEELAERIRFIAPTDADITREVDAFLAKSLAAPPTRG